MIDIAGTPAIVTATVQVTRAATGQVETYTLTGRIAHTDDDEKEPEDASDPHDGGA